MRAVYDIDTDNDLHEGRSQKSNSFCLQLTARRWQQMAVVDNQLGRRGASVILAGARSLSLPFSINNSTARFALKGGYVCMCIDIYFRSCGGHPIINA
jgi:hypothetical protein